MRSFGLFYETTVIHDLAASTARRKFVAKPVHYYSRALFLQVYTVKRRTPETVIMVVFFTDSGVFFLFFPVLLVRGAYANPRIGNYSLFFYRFWGLRTICTSRKTPETVKI